ncbi:MAG: hypothetical protein EBR02_01570 [Alphaproteobacteria bacterium]|nr:hypothetical protein [Alphaproteobacteria bacterium]
MNNSDSSSDFFNNELRPIFKTFGPTIVKFMDEKVPDRGNTPYVIFNLDGVEGVHNALMFFMRFWVEQKSAKATIPDGFERCGGVLIQKISDYIMRHKIDREKLDYPDLPPNDFAARDMRERASGHYILAATVSCFPKEVIDMLFEGRHAAV